VPQCHVKTESKAGEGTERERLLYVKKREQALKGHEEVTHKKMIGVKKDSCKIREESTFKKDKLQGFVYYYN